MDDRALLWPFHYKQINGSEIGNLLFGTLIGPVVLAVEALARLDERLSRSPFQEGWIQRQHFGDACAVARGRIGACRRQAVPFWGIGRLPRGVQHFAANKEPTPSTAVSIISSSR